MKNVMVSIVAADAARATSGKTITTTKAHATAPSPGQLRGTIISKISQTIRATAKEDGNRSHFEIEPKRRMACRIRYEAVAISKIAKITHRS